MTKEANARGRADRIPIVVRITTVIFLFVAGLVTTAAPANAGPGGRMTMLRDDGSAWGVTLFGAGYDEIALAADTDGNRAQELVMYSHGRFTIRNDDGSYGGVTFPGVGPGEFPIAADTNGDGRQEFGVYFNGRFTMRRDDGSLWGVTFPGAGVQEMPLAVDTNGDGIQEFGVYRAGRFSFLRPDGSAWGVTFFGATANDLPFVIDTDGNRAQELAVYRNGRMTVRADDGTHWGVNVPGAGMDEYPVAVDTNADGRQEFAVYSHTVAQVFAKQLLANDSIDKTTERLVLDDLIRTAIGQPGSSQHYISSAILRNVVKIAGNHTLRISAFESGGRGHGSNSLHYSGDAVDISRIDGQILTGRDPLSLSAIVAIMYDLLPSGPDSVAGIGQSNCGATPALPAGIRTFSDSCNHLHIQVPLGTY